MLISTYVTSHNCFEENNTKVLFRGKYSFPIQHLGKVFEMNLNVEYFSNSTYRVSYIYQLANPLHLYNHPSRRLARSLHIPRHTFDSLKISGFFRVENGVSRKGSILDNNSTPNCYHYFVIMF
jgi:hypothetical protein